MPSHRDEESSYLGTLERHKLGAGGWILVDDNGKRWQLNGDVPASLSGRRVQLEGRPARAAFSFSMAGPTLEVSAIGPVKEC